MLAGEVAAARGDRDEALRRLRKAVELEDGLHYDEPSPWTYPTRHALGAALLEAGQAAAAEQVYRDDLARNPENGWALFGLAASLRAQGRTADAAAAEARFTAAWSHADVALTASRF
jgi:tetratricopeptide (TPR) repeat protein